MTTENKDIKELRVTVDVVLFYEKDFTREILLINRLYEPFKDFYALPGGHIENHEPLEVSASRELLEETNVSIHPELLKYVNYYDQTDRDPRGRYISFAYYKVLDNKPNNIKAQDDAKDVKWFDINNLPQLAFVHFQIIKEAYAKAFWPKIGQKYKYEQRN